MSINFVKFTILDTGFYNKHYVAKISKKDYYNCSIITKTLIPRVCELSPKYWIFVIPYRTGESIIPDVHKGECEAFLFNGVLILTNPEKPKSKLTQVDIKVLACDEFYGQQFIKIPLENFKILQHLTNYEIECLRHNFLETSNEICNTVWVPTGMSIIDNPPFYLYDTILLSC